jgi:hypothetical protein
LSLLGVGCDVPEKLDMRKRFRGNNYGVTPEQFDDPENLDVAGEKDA